MPKRYCNLDRSRILESSSYQDLRARYTSRQGRLGCEGEVISFFHKNEWAHCPVMTGGAGVKGHSRGGGGCNEELKKYNMTCSLPTISLTYF
jgi:hypothetical protein